MTRPAQPRNMTQSISHDRLGERSKKIISIQGATVKIFLGIKMAATSGCNSGLIEGGDRFWIFVTARVSRCPLHPDAFSTAKGRFVAPIQWRKANKLRCFVPNCFFLCSEIDGKAQARESCGKLMEHRNSYTLV